MSLAIDVRNLRKRFGTHTVLDGVDLDVRRGEIFALLGPNGAGKTTIVNILTTLVRPDDGHALVAGVDVAADPVSVTQRIAFTGQAAAVDERLTARENLVMFARLSGLPSRAAGPRAEELLDRFALSEASGRRVGTFSGGMRRRLDLALSLVAQPEVLFLDEPTTGLDTRSRRELWQIIASLAGSGTTVFLTTQYLEEADQLADRIAVIDGGRIVADDTAAALKQRVGTDRLRLVLDPADLDPAAALLGPDAVVREDTVEVPLADPDHLRRVLDALHGAGLEVRSTELDRPTLDDVFLTLTGASA